MSMLLVQTIGSIALVVSLMFATGLRLRLHELRAVARRPQSIAWAVVANVLVLPALTMACASALALPTQITVALMLCAAAPGGPTSALYTTIAGADLALAAGLTILLPAIGVLTTPLTLSATLQLPADAEVPVLPMIVSLIAMQVLPLAAGMQIRARWSGLADRLTPWAARLANLVLAGMVVMLTAIKGHLLLDISGPTWLALLGLTLAALLLGAAGDPRRRDSARAGALVAACRNVSVAIMLASTFFVDPLIDATVLTYGFVTFTTPLLLALWWRRRP